jgi:hypothetical protein
LKNNKEKTLTDYYKEKYVTLPTGEDIMKKVLDETNLDEILTIGLEKLLSTIDRKIKETFAAVSDPKNKTELIIVPCFNIEEFNIQELINDKQNLVNNLNEILKVMNKIYIGKKKNYNPNEKRKCIECSMVLQPLELSKITKYEDIEAEETKYIKYLRNIEILYIEILSNVNRIINE